MIKLSYLLESLAFQYQPELEVNRSIVLAEGPDPSALGHNFHVHGVVPSVTFVVNIPESANDSFYQGKAYVRLKDKVTQPSSTLRHKYRIV